MLEIMRIVIIVLNLVYAFVLAAVIIYVVRVAIGRIASALRADSDSDGGGLA